MQEDYISENIKLYKGDCLDVLKSIPDNSVDVVVSDIPYGISYSKWDVIHDNKNTALLGASPAQKGNSNFKTRGKPLNGWSLSDKSRGHQFETWCEDWLKELYRITKPCSPVMIMCGRQMQHRFTCAAENTGFIFKDYITWNKSNAPFRAQRVNCVTNTRGLDKNIDDCWRLGNLAPLCEPIVWLFKPYPQGTTVTDNYLENGLGCFNSEILKTNLVEVNSHIKSKKHETEKPVQLMEILINLVSQENHIVLDMFMGSGTTGVACKNLNRKFIGVEMDEKYFDIAKNRILGE